jgi:hypothetical protein
MILHCLDWGYQKKFNTRDKLILMNTELQYYLQQNFELPVAVNEMQDAEIFLAEKINTLIKNDFNLLVQILYRVDVNEARLKQLLKDNASEDAGKIIGALLVERQLQKINTRKQFTRRDDTFSEEERW